MVALESDGSALLYLGNLTTMANKRSPNLTVIVFDNQCYLAIGGLPTATAGVKDLAGMARAAGIANSYEVKTNTDFEERVRVALKSDGPSYIVAKVDAEKDVYQHGWQGSEIPLCPVHRKNGRYQAYWHARYEDGLKA